MATIWQQLPQVFPKDGLQMGIVLGKIYLRSGFSSLMVNDLRCKSWISQLASSLSLLSRMRLWYFLYLRTLYRLSLCAFSRQYLPEIVFLLPNDWECVTFLSSTLLSLSQLLASSKVKFLVLVSCIETCSRNFCKCKALFIFSCQARDLEWLMGYETEFALVGWEGNFLQAGCWVVYFYLPIDAMLYYYQHAISVREGLAIFRHNFLMISNQKGGGGCQ